MIHASSRRLSRLPEGLGEIAERCGFNDYSNFVRTFKNAYGVTPTEYRRSNAGSL